MNAEAAAADANLFSCSDISFSPFHTNEKSHFFINRSVPSVLAVTVTATDPTALHQSATRKFKRLKWQERFDSSGLTVWLPVTPLRDLIADYLTLPRMRPAARPAAVRRISFSVFAIGLACCVHACGVRSL